MLFCICTQNKRRVPRQPRPGDSSCEPAHSNQRTTFLVARALRAFSSILSSQRTDDGDQDENDDDDDIDEDEDEGFESDVGRDAQARLASDSFLSVRCESEFFNMDSFSSSDNTPDEDEGEEEDEEDEQEGECGAGQEEQREQRRVSLGGRPRSREYRRGSSNGGSGGGGGTR